VEFGVADTGIGIRPEDLPRLFQHFPQLESAYTKRHAGSGIGLALTRRLVELHGGRIWAKSEGEGKGATFRVLLAVSSSADRWKDAVFAGNNGDLSPTETRRIGQIA
jgi:signal transduction histidine kinase